MMKYQKYEKYKISNNPWFSELPENWDVSRIKFNSILFGRIGYRGYSTDDLVDEKEGAITLSPSNMNNGKLDFSKCTYLSWDKYNESPEIKMRDHDVVMVKTGSTIGKVSFAEKIEYPTTINPQLVLYKKIKCNPKFLFYYLFSKNAQDRIPLYNSGSTIPTMKQEDIGRFYLPMPSINEQNSIVEFLDRETTHIDTLIEKKQKLIELLKEKRTAFITQAVTKGLNPDVKMKDSGIEWLGEVPEYWEVKKLKFSCKVIMGQSPDSSDYSDDEDLLPFLQGNAEFSDIHPVPKIFCASSNKHALKNDILISVRAPIGAVNIADKKYGIGRGLCAIRCNNQIFNYMYYQFLIKKDEFNSIGTGSTFTAISVDEVKNTLVILPPTHEQEKIAKYIENESVRIGALLAKIQLAINKHKEYRIALISAAVTGKIKVTQD